MFSCLWQLWDWLDPTSMENKKANCNFNSNNITPNVEVTLNEAIPKHQHNTAPQNLRLLQYGLKIPNHQHIQINQQLNTSAPPQHLHIHQHQNVQHQQQPQQQTQQQTQQQLQFQPAQTLRQNINQKYVQPHQHKSQIPNPLYGQSMYQTTQTPPPPPPLHGHQMMQNTPQIWMPHQPPPIHYHNQQQQQQKELQSQKTPTTPVTPTVPKKENDKKKSGGTQLRSPSAKRPPEAPVTMQGWLHKQGSEGLMLWKKRWFVLSEYCLFYYKGSEEEKLLGSILLPSYKVSICGPEDKVNKKYAFKCEHANMRTYILAADSHELMMQWVRVLNLACMLESHNENETLTVSMPEEKIPLPLQQQQQQIRNTPVHNHSSSNTTELSNPSQQEFQYNQPLYANAPPKPRRLNDTSGYYSPSPEVMDRYPNPQIYARNLAKSPVNYGHNMMTPEYVHRPKHNIYDYYPPNIVPQNTERRTPDTYGRSKLSTPKRQHQTDYEDVYGEMYKRPLSPVAYNHQMIKKSPYPSPYMPVNNIMGPDLMSKYPVQMRKSPSIARPHSADFLEYEVNHRQNNTATRQQPRPKSSLDINRHENSNDNYFYSEERYAEKMRKSAQYLQNMPRYQTENTFPLMRSNTQPLHLNLPPLNNNTNQEQRVFNQPVRSRSVLSEGSLSKELDADLVASTKELDRGPSPGYSQQRKTDYDQFTRSASARLTHNLNEDKSLRDGDRKREESMKRLLEWKQRMLQSPLNRKAQAQSNRSFHPKPDHYYQDNNIYLMQKIEQDGRRSVTNLPQYNSYSSDDEASGSIQLNQRDIRDTFPRTASSTAAANKKMWMPQPHHSQQNLQARSVTNLNRNDDHYRHPQQYGYYVSQSSSQHDLNAENIYARKENLPVLNEKLNVSAGELLGRTHEELVLLLIQLRRQSSQTLQAIENCYNEIDSIQAQLHLMDKIKRMENLQKLEQIKQHLLELEKQYEKGKPLVNLVDNMVKLGSLYRSPQDRYNVSPYIRDRLEFNQQIQERRLLAEEKRDWDRLTPNHVQLQEKVQQLYQLDRLIQEESGTLQNLQQDKEDIERALGGLRMKLNKGFSDPAEVEQARKQQALLENELSRVHMMLAKNSKKLEETVAGNARLEQELLVLKQKLQTSRQQRSSPQFSNAGDSLPCAVGTSAMLESDLQKVQKKIGDLQKQRQELSMQVRQLTDRSNLVIKSPNSQNGQCKRKVTSCWRETDLDTMNIIDHGDGENWRSSTSPLYINTKQSESDYYNNRSTMKGSDSASDDTQTYLPPEKQEIKTVRIVKRESERRQRDREKIGNSNSNKWDALIEEDDSSQSSSVLFRPAPIQKTQSTTSISPVYEDKSSGFLSRQSSLSSPSIPQFSDSQNLEASDKSLQLSPVFKSEAARQIITEMSSNQEFPKPGQANRRAVPKEKRRHYTAPYNNMIMKSLNQLPTDDNAFDKMIMNTRRARDDLDMERALRQRIDAPDVVRSTLSNKETKFNESTIDSILGTPNKISIPERYIPEQLPQLSAEEQEHRLRKVESIKKMLSDTAIISASTSTSEDKSPDKQSNSILNKATSKIIEEKKQREHLLQLNQILAKQVMEMSKIVAVKALANLPLKPQEMNDDDEDASPVTPLPLYQQRDNFFT